MKKEKIDSGISTKLVNKATQQKNKNALQEFIEKEVKKIHKQNLLENELREINKKLSFLNEDDTNSNEQKTYEMNMYENYSKDLEEVVKNLADACNKLESSALKQEKHIKSLPQVEGRMNEGKRHKDIILEIFKEVKKAKIAAERKLYNIR